MGPFPERLSAALAQREQDDLYRHRLTLDSAQGPVVQLGAANTSIFAATITWAWPPIPRYRGVSRGGAPIRRRQWRFPPGVWSQRPHHQLEEALAEFTGRPRALLFSSGYMANTGVLTTLLQRGDHVFEDRLNHASLLDGGLHSGARFQRFLTTM